VLADNPEQVEIGITVAPEYQGKGYAMETLRALLTYLLVELRKHRVFGSVDPRNESSMRLLERVGCARKRTS
jgi:RimJ/RimL family protein N-acetyltransferase